MNKNMWSGRILLKYAAMQLPGIAVVVLFLILVRRWIDFPSWLSWTIIGLWISKDVVFYPLVWMAYDWGSEEEKSPMVGQIGITEEPLVPSGTIFIRGELWRARAVEDDMVIEKGEKVIVRRIKGLTLYVDLDRK